ncbi:MAG: DUF2267 domain-containing protein [Desulfobacteraceae bacterium]|nr:MAG: DUF2267 domain-containing protein [Desulfobacteraceae bacterium]
MPKSDIFEKTLHETQDWIKDVEYELGWEDLKHQSFQALRGTLAALRDRLTPEEAAHLGAQLPALLRGFYYEGWQPAHKPEKIGEGEFFKRVTANLNTNTPAQDIVRAVFKMLYHRISQGESEDIKSILPKELASLWPQKAESKA